MKISILSAALSLMLFCTAAAQTRPSDKTAGFVIEESNPGYTVLAFKTGIVRFEEISIDGKKMVYPLLEGVFLPSESGAPNLPGTGRLLAVPNGSEPVVEILSVKTSSLQHMHIAPAPVIPKETETGLVYRFNQEIYGADALYPAEPVRLSPKMQIRGVESVMIGITPFQYNPVNKELTVIEEVRLKVTHQGDGTYGQDRLRSRWFDPLLQDMLLNPAVLPEKQYNQTYGPADDDGFEYLIIVPNDAIFYQWADSIKKFRTEQGILTGIKTLAQVGGNTPAALESYINNAYNTWSIPPAAILLLGDYGSNAANTITSPVWDNYCVSDNILGDVNNDELPDIVMARITAQNEAQLQVMVKKFLQYETNPPVNPAFYNHPISALGWQTERWFQICSEVVGGFWTHSLGKSPVRINAVYAGNPASDPWSTATNTSTVVNYFGPSGLGYIPATPQALGGWSGGTATMVNNAINSGAFMLQHRDHGYEQGWGEPAYSSSSINGLTNTDLCFVMSINCLTGKYNYGSEVFAEKFHRYTYGENFSGALGLLAASEISYSFVNDAYVWGVYDNLWPAFMPGYGSNPAHRGILPAFGNAAGKYFLFQSSWPYNTGNKTVTYHLFHHHGDAFLSVFSEVPQTLAVVHDPVIYAGITSFAVNANAGSLICLSLNGEILATATGTGFPVTLNIPGNQIPPDQIKVVVTLQNYYRYTGTVQVIPPSGPYVTRESSLLTDPNGNNNGLLDYGEQASLTLGMKNVGILTADNVTVTLHSADPWVSITDSTAFYGNIAPGATVSVPSGFAFNAAAGIPDQHTIPFSATASDGTNSWISHFSLKANAPLLEYQQYQITDPTGNGNNKADPGEVFSLSIYVINEGHAEVSNVTGTLTSADPYLNILSNNLNFGNIPAGVSAVQSFQLSASILAPLGHQAMLNVNFTGDLGITATGTLSLIIGQIPVLILNLDANNNGGQAIQAAVQANNVSSVMLTSMPADPDIYSSIFLCLGIYPNNHVLSQQEGQILTTYLNNGGQLYMEGGDTWAYDAQTTVHPLFMIEGLADGSADLVTVNGQNATFTQGMTFSYNGENSWIDRLGPASGSTAFAILKNQSPSYTTAMAYQSATYKTIGASHEFAGLANGDFPSTRNELMFQYLQFFGLVNLNVNAAFMASDSVILEGESIQFTDLSTGNPSSWEWTFPGGNPSVATIPNPTVTYNSPGIYSVTLTVSNGYTVSSITRTDYILVGSQTLTGQLTYDNSLSTPLNNTLVLLKQGSANFAQATTGAGGNYQLEQIPPGNYSLDASCPKPWGGVNATDALLIMKQFVGLGQLSGIRLIAADVDNNTMVNAVDALAVQRRTVGMISGFPAGNWVFEKPLLFFSGLSQINQDFKGLCTGDVNGSYTPPAKQQSSLSFHADGVLVVKPGHPFNLPVSTTTVLSPAALTLHLEIQNDMANILDIRMIYDQENLIWQRTGNTLSLSWYSLRPRPLNPGQELLSITLDCESFEDNATMFTLLQGELAGINGEPLFTSLNIPWIQASDDDFRASLSPNPASDESMLLITLEQDEALELCLYDLGGRLVNRMECGLLPAGSHEIAFMPDGLEAGIYFIRIHTGSRKEQLRLVKTN
ncbi:MAG TPA: C25 family cysteine peptidase [Bacteroidales bacterium]|nr:C25 family cysteine peptidase [Bacteroidales bacterium]HSA42266.1 C25 family cysteine peptidase [Bacteroidales bacterium]